LGFSQIKAKGGSIKKGEKCTYGVYYNFFEVPKDRKDPDGEKIKRAFLKYFKVWNLDQVEGIEAPTTDDTPTEEVNPLADCEAILDAMKNPATVKHGGSRAYYVPTQDHIQMPDMQAFDNAEAYYSTRFHETVHSTGHSSRVNRPGVTDCTYFGSTNYSEEELVAEMGAAYLCGIVGIDNGTAENSAAYLRGWLKKLKDDKKILVKAAFKAQKAVDYILGTTFEEKTD